MLHEVDRQNAEGDQDGDEAEHPKASSSASHRGDYYWPHNHTSASKTTHIVLFIGFI